jgi:hypothetical protein
MNVNKVVVLQKSKIKNLFKFLCKDRSLFLLIYPSEELSIKLHTYGRIIKNKGLPVSPTGIRESKDTLNIVRVINFN